MFRAGLSISLLVVSALSTPLSAQEAPVAKTPVDKTVQLEIVLATAAVSDPGTITESPTGTEMLARIEEWSKTGKLTSLTRVRVSAVEQSPAEIQFSEVVPIITGVTARAGFSSGRGGNPVMQQQPTSTREDAGTLISATSRVEESGTIIVDLKVEQSRFESLPARPEGEEEKSFPLPPAKKMQTGHTTIRLKNGQPELVGGFTESAAGSTTQSVILLTARIQNP